MKQEKEKQQHLSERDQLLQELEDLTSAERTKKEQEELDELRLIVRTKRELGRAGVDYVVVHCPLGKIVVKKPDPLVWRAASEKVQAAPDEPAMEKIALDLCTRQVFGSTTNLTVQELALQCPGAITACFRAVAFLMGEESHRLEKK